VVTHKESVIGLPPQLRPSEISPLQKEGCTTRTASLTYPQKLQESHYYLDTLDSEDDDFLTSYGAPPSMRNLSLQDFILAPVGVALLACSSASRAEPPREMPDSSGMGITLEADTLIPPGPPGTVRVSHRDSLHTVSWLGTRDDRIIGYQVYRRCPNEEWQAIASLRLLPGDDRNQGAYSIEDRFSVQCEYTVAAIGRNGKQGPKAAEIQ
jgi:hypothetical protein